MKEIVLRKVELLTINLDEDFLERVCHWLKSKNISITLNDLEDICEEKETIYDRFDSKTIADIKFWITDEIIGNPKTFDCTELKLYIDEEEE